VVQQKEYNGLKSVHDSQLSPRVADLSLQNYLNSQNAYAHNYEHYVGDAAFLWILRSLAVTQPHYTANDIWELEQRIEVSLDGLMTSIDMGWQACESALELQEPGEVFAATVIALRSHEVSKIQKTVEVGLENDLATPGLISAMGWLPADITNPWTERFLKSKEMSHKYLGTAICSVRRQDPGKLLTNILLRDDCLQHEKLYARALRLTGELRRQDGMPAINQAMSADSEGIRFWATWSAALLGHQGCAHNFQPFIAEMGPYQNQAIQLAFRILPVEQAREWISKLVEDESQVRAVIKAIGVLGDPHAINWLIHKMQVPEVARLAGEAFSHITGIDLKKNQLLMEFPDSPLPSIPDDEIENNHIGLDEDEHLPYPDAEKITAIWREHGQHFIVGHRYFMGHPVTAPEALKEIVKKGTQRQRHAAAMELALTENGLPLANTCARIRV